MKKKRGLGDCPQGFAFDFVFVFLFLLFTRPFIRSVFSAWFLREKRAGARLGLKIFSRFMRKDLQTPCRWSSPTTGKAAPFLRPNREERAPKARAYARFPQKSRGDLA
ncbi:MAG: hypothetical protein HQL73_02210 [Magnetococcales bacterium]|nr:hypothetical protein [Magnetococcales bacterium]